MAFGRIVYIVVAAFVAVLLFCTVSAEADESEAAPVAGFSIPHPELPPVPEAGPEGMDEAKPDKLSEGEAPPIVVIIQKMISEDIFFEPPVDVPDVEEVDEPEEIPVELIPLRPPPNDFKRVMKLNFESMLELYLLQKSLSNANCGKDDDVEEVEEQEIVIIEESDAEQVIEPAPEVAIILPEFVIHVPTPILNTAGDAVGPISVF